MTERRLNGIVPTAKDAPVTAAERRAFEAVRDAATLQLLFKASRLANERALAWALVRSFPPRHCRAR